MRLHPKAKSAIIALTCAVSLVVAYIWGQRQTAMNSQPITFTPSEPMSDAELAHLPAAADLTQYDTAFRLGTMGIFWVSIGLLALAVFMTYREAKLKQRSKA